MTPKAMLALVATVTLLGSAFARESFDGHKVVQIETRLQSDLDAVNAWIEAHPEVDVWQSPALGGSAHLNLPQAEVDALDMPHTVFVDDVASLIRASYQRSSSQDWHAEYHTLAESDQYIADWAEKFADHPVLAAELFTIGQSYENRTINGLKFGGGQVSNPVKIVWNGIHHAREWIGPATLFYLIDSLITGFVENDPQIAILVAQAEFHVLPILNPDGYEYTWNSNRLWRKTRSNWSGGLFYGTDPNRNWDYQWGGDGASSLPLSDTYRGPYAFSEPEVAQWANYINNLGNVGGYIDWHSYGQYILGAWGYTNTLPVHYAEQTALASAMNDAIRVSHGRSYVFGPSGSTLYTTSGSAPDYTYGHTGIVNSYTIELPGSPGGFVLPPQYIRGVGEESLDGAIVFVRACLAKNSGN